MLVKHFEPGGAKIVRRDPSRRVVTATAARCPSGPPLGIPTGTHNTSADRVPSWGSASLPLVGRRRQPRRREGVRDPPGVHQLVKSPLAAPEPDPQEPFERPELQHVEPPVPDLLPAPDPVVPRVVHPPLEPVVVDPVLIGEIWAIWEIRVVRVRNCRLGLPVFPICPFIVSGTGMGGWMCWSRTQPSITSTGTPNCSAAPSTVKPAAKLSWPSRRKRTKSNAKGHRPDSGRFRNTLENALILPEIGP